MASKTDSRGSEAVETVILAVAKAEECARLWGSCLRVLLERQLGLGFGRRFERGPGPGRRGIRDAVEKEEEEERETSVGGRSWR
jgi:hypothetical protein